MAPRTRRSTAYHEAGHAVGHHFFPLSGRTKSITIARDRVAEYNADKHEINQAGGLHFVKATLPAIVGRSVDREQVHHQIMALLAGPAAGWLYAGLPEKGRKLTKARREEIQQHASGADDHSRVLKLLYDAAQFDMRDIVRGIPEGDRERLSQEQLIERYANPAIQSENDRVLAELSRYYREAFAFVASKWLHVQALADALFRQKTLEGDEVTAIIEAVEARIQEGPPDLWAAEP